MGILVWGFGLAMLNFSIVSYAVLNTPGAYIRFDLALLAPVLINGYLSFQFREIGITRSSVLILILTNFIMVAIAILIRLYTKNVT